MHSRFNIRDFFWNYPKFLSEFIKITNPLSSILFAFVLGFLVFSTLTSDLVSEFVDGRDTTKVTEAVVGSLISTNPMYVTQNSVDRDFYKLVYEKFVEIDIDGQPLPNIALGWEQKDDLEYVFRIRNDVFWHDGTRLTSDDIVWNFETAILLAEDFGEETYGVALEGVEVEKIDSYSIRFVLSETNATFWEAISVYMLPRHLYEEIPIQDFSLTKTNTRPIGCGMYQVSSISQKGFNLIAFENYWKESSIVNYRYLFFEDYDSLNSAVKNNEIDIITTYDIEKIEDLADYPFFKTEQSVLYNRQKLIYFNTRKEKFSNSNIRKALSLLINKEKLLEDSGVNGEIAKGPISPNSWAFNDSVEYLGYEKEQANEILEELGYVRDLQDEYYVTQEDGKILSVELAFFENDMNLKLVNTLVELLKKEGVLLKLRPLTYDQILREILPTRDFELLLYEIEVTVDPDQYNLWHSLRIDHPMLNISGYDYSRVDILLERARTNTDLQERKEDYFLFQRYLVDDAPVIFLYHPRVFFVLRKSLEGFNVEKILTPSERYENIQNWYWSL